MKGKGSGHMEGKAKEIEAMWTHVNNVEERLERKYQRRTKREAWLIYFSVVIIAIITAVAVYFIRIEGTSVLMKHLGIFDLLIPALGLIVSVYFVYLGVTRLKDMDEHMNRIQDTVNSTMNREVNHILGRVDEKVEHIDELEKGVRDEIKKQVEDDIQNEVEFRMNKVSEEFKEKIEEFEKFGNEIKDRYSWLLENINISEKLYVGDGGTVDSVRLAIAGLRHKKDRPKHYASAVTGYINRLLGNNNNNDEIAEIRGTGREYHLLIVELYGQGFHKLALKVCTRALEYYKRNDYLLADHIWCAIGLGGEEIKRASSSVEELRKIPMSQWNWRAFDYVARYYVNTGMINNAEDVAEKFKKYYPNNEHAYYRLSRIYKRKYPTIPNGSNLDEGYNKEVEILKEAVNRRNMSCPRCATRLAKIYAKGENLEEALYMANRAIEELGRSKPRADAKNSYVIYLRALIRDRLAYKERERGMLYNANGHAREAAVDYVFAINSEQLESAQDANADERLRMLDTYFDLGGYSLEVRKALKERKRRIEALW